MTKAYQVGFVDAMRKLAQDASLTQQLTGVNGPGLGQALAGYLGLAAAGAGAGALLSEKGKRGKGALKGALLASLVGEVGQRSKRRLQGKFDEQNSKIKALEDQLRPLVEQEAKRKADFKTVINGGR